MFVLPENILEEIKLTWIEEVLIKAVNHQKNEGYNLKKVFT